MTSTEHTLSSIQSEAFENLYKTHYSRLFTLAFRMTGTRENAEDVLQTSFVKAWSGFSKFRSESSPYTWLYRIVLNTAKSHLIEWKKMPMDTYAQTHGYSLEEAYGYVRRFGEVEDEVLITRVRESCLQMFMNCMPTKYRSVYALRGMLQFSAKDTAEILDISEDAVKTNLHRARKHARDHLKGRCSLVKPGSLCDCRATAAYVKCNERMGRIQNIDVIRHREAEAVENFTQEMTELLAVEGLFATELVGLDYDTFKERLKGLKKEGAFTLLDY